MATSTWSVVAELDATMMQQTPDDNFDDDVLPVDLLFFGGVKSFWRRSILKFNLGSYPGESDGSDITSAKLTVEVQSRENTGEQVDFERVDEHASDVVETEVTWNEASSGVSWTSSGGDTTPTDRATTTVPPVTGVLDIPGFKNLVIDALVNRSGDLWIIVRMDDEADAGDSRYMNFYSSEKAGVTKPTLVITYTVPTTAQPTGRRSVPRSSFGETARSARPAAPGRAFAGARTAQPSRPQRRRPR